MEAILAAVPPIVLRKGRDQLLARRLSLFAIGWITTTLAWGLTLTVESRLAVFPAALLFTFQLGVLIAAIAICHAKGSTAHVPLVVLAACVLLGISSTSMFAAIGGYGDMLMFILLTLFLASTPFFAWSGRAALMLIVGTLLPWVMALPFLHFILRPAELAASIAIGAGACFVTLQWSRRDFGRVLGDAVTADVCREVTECSGDLIFAVDEYGRFMYVNAAVAALANRPASALIGQHLQSFFMFEDPGDAALHGGDEREIFIWRANTVLGVRLFEVVTWRRRDGDGNSIGACIVGRDVSDRQDASRPSTPAAAQEDSAAIALLREPLRILEDEEVRRLRQEVKLLRRQVERGATDPANGEGEEHETQAASSKTGDHESPRYQFPERYRRKRKRPGTPPAGPALLSRE